MRIFRINHVTSYSYESMVHRSRNLCLQLPRLLPYQEIHKECITINPIPESTFELSDGLGNRLCDFTVVNEHKEFSVAMDLLVTVHARQWPRGCSTRSQALDLMKQLRNPRHLESLPYLYPSHHVQWDSGIELLTADLLHDGLPPWECGRVVMERIFREWKFQANVTGIHTTVHDLLSNRVGVCQDFSHLMLAAIRQLGFPARYVSGYIETLPKPGRPKLIGADVSHAWVQVYDPLGGWMDFDPTNHLIPSEQHITVAFGRDFADISPLRGLVSGGGKQTMKVSVDVSAQAGI